MESSHEHTGRAAMRSMAHIRTFVTALLAAAASFVFAASDQDMELVGGYVNQHKWASMYGRGSDFQLARAIAERVEQFVEPQAQTVFRSHGDLRNLPVFPPDYPKTLYRTWWSMRGCAPYRPEDVVPVSCMDSGNFEELKRQYNSVHGCIAIVAPTCAVLCAAADALRQSYSIPPFGVVLFDYGAWAEEHAHFFNWSPPGETSTGFSAEPLNEVTSWGEFKAAYRGLKLDAWRLGYDVGLQGGMDAYVMDLTGEVPRVSTNWCSVATNIVEVEMVDGTPVTNIIELVSVAEVVTHDDLLTFTNRVPSNSVKLLDAYIEARAAAGTASDNADYERLRAWMTNIKIGRMVL